MPLSGDEGAGFGLYKHQNPEFVLPDDLCFGKRELSPSGKDPIVPGVEIIHREDLGHKVYGLLQNDRIINVVTGSMEYGPRAYCNTSTLALPSERNKEYINKINARHRAMPMCPVLCDYQCDNYFTQHEKLVRTREHMITTMEWSGLVLYEKYLGILHEEADGRRTGRPQVVYRGHWLYDALDVMGPLINTSFNNHGHPICMSFSDAMRTHEAMLTLDEDDRVITLIAI
jgi:predicted NodU family carbamoyl transferase